MLGMGRRRPATMSGEEEKEVGGKQREASRNA
jgi:hypothetical protein